MNNYRKYFLILVCCAVALLVLIVFEPRYGWAVRGWLEGRSEAGSYDLASGAAAEPSNDAALSADNEALQAQLATLASVASEIPQNPNGAIRAMVYVQYPFGFKNELLVNAGSDEGVATGSAVTFQGIFIGTIAHVFKDSSVVQTVFDPTLKMPVRIGGAATAPAATSYDALLVGGAAPKATSIAKTAALNPGDIIYTAAPGLPYGLPIGVVNATSASGDNLFQEAPLNFIYDVNTIETVLIAH